jgi:tetratricopeptide (TPR) repeat protein
MTQLAPLSAPADHDTLLRTAMRHFRAGALDAAAAPLLRILTADPKSPRALLLLGLVRDGQDDLPAAERCYGDYLALCPEDGFAVHRLGRLHQARGDDARAAPHFALAAALRPAHAPGFNDLGAALYRLGENDRALVAFDRAVALDPSDATSHGNRARLLAALHRDDAAAAAFRALLELPPRGAADWTEHAGAWLHFGDLARAEEACRRALAACDDAESSARIEARMMLAEVLERARRGPEAAGERAAAGEATGVVTRRCLGGQAEARVLLVAGAGLCNLPTGFLIDRNRFDIVTVQVPPNETDCHALAQRLAGVDVAFNVVGDADAGAPFLAGVAALGRLVPVRLLNPPDAIPRTRRDRLAQTLGDIPGVVVPRTRRVDRADLEASVSSRPAGRVLLRPVGTHGGADLLRIDSPPHLSAALATTPGESFYVSDFNDFRSADGWYRKYRFVFVGGALFPVHLAICAEWLAHYWRAEMTHWMLAEEAAFLADPASVFAGQAGAGLAMVATRSGLDYGGIDCAKLPDGRMLLFEANATMLVHVTGANETKRAEAARVRDAMSALLLGAR